MLGLVSSQQPGGRRENRIAALIRAAVYTVGLAIVIADVHVINVVLVWALLLSLLTAAGTNPVKIALIGVERSCRTRR